MVGFEKKYSYRRIGSRFHIFFNDESIANMNYNESIVKNMVELLNTAYNDGLVEGMWIGLDTLGSKSNRIKQDS